MPTTRVRAALADLTQDIAGRVPVALLQRWAAGAQDQATAEALLDDYRLDGQVVATDTSGLTRMTEERDLLDVMALISKPKEVVHGLGTAIGGRPIGVWVADNTEMFYPSSIDAGLVLDAMLEARARIAAAVPVGIGMCLHAGRFYEIGGGLYGDDADAVEGLAEDHAGPGEILVTSEWLARALAPPDCQFRPRADLQPLHASGVFLVDTCRRRPDLREHDPDYPPPFPRPFLEALRRLHAEPQPDALRAATYGRYQRELAVVFVSVVVETSSGSALPRLLDRLLHAGVVDSIVKGRMGLAESVYGSGQGYLILAFAEPRQALVTAEDIRARFAERGLAVRIGIDLGPVLAFDDPPGARQIAGGAVNIASKLSVDAGVAGAIQVTDRAARHLGPPPGTARFDLDVSAVRLTGYRL
jgi:hypothetical protein